MLRQAQHERKMVVTANTSPIALSTVEGCAQSTRYNVLVKYASSQACPERKPKDRFIARLASEIFLSSLQHRFFSNLLV